MSSLGTKGLIGFGMQMPYGGTRDLNFFRRTTRKGGAEEAQVCIAYGANGVGKSSIAGVMAGNNSRKISLLYLDGHEVEADPAELDNVFVFNEEFVDRNVRTQSQGMTPFVMLGDQVAGQDDVEKARQKEEDQRERLQAAEEDESSANAKNQEARGNLKKSLKSENSWASRARDIHEGQKNVQESLVDDLLEVPHEDAGVLGSLKKQFERDLSDLNKVRHARTCDWEFTSIIDPFDWDEINSLKKWERPEVFSSNTDQELLARLDEGHPGATAREALKAFLQSSTWCDKCLQEISGYPQLNVVAC